MSFETSTLFSLARSKLHLSVGSKDSSNLHRWVLLKNSIINSPTLTTNSVTESDVHSLYPPNDGEEDDSEDMTAYEETDSFMFPDAGKFVASQRPDSSASEAQWLDSLLETLGDDDDDDFGTYSDTHISPAPVEEDEDQLLSPMGSSDDLPNQQAFYRPPLPLSHHVTYHPFVPPALPSFQLDLPLDSTFSSFSSSLDHPLPYHDTDDIEDLSLPETVEDTSDDESDAPPTPSLGRSNSSLSLADSGSTPSTPPVERSRLSDTAFFAKERAFDCWFGRTPLSYSDTPRLHNSYNPYEDC